MTYALELKDLRKSFGKTEIIRGVNLAVLPGERCRIGPGQFIRISTSQIKAEKVDLIADAIVLAMG